MNFEKPTMEEVPKEEGEQEDVESKEEREVDGSIIDLEDIPEGFNLESAMDAIESSESIPTNVKEEIIADIKELNPWSETDEIVSEFNVSKEGDELVVNITWDKKYPGGGPGPASASEPEGWLWKNSSMGYSLEDAKSE